VSAVRRGLVLVSGLPFGVVALAAPAHARPADDDADRPCRAAPELSPRTVPKPL
jgi:hypothetical protein